MACLIGAYGLKETGRLKQEADTKVGGRWIGREIGCMVNSITDGLFELA